MNDKMDLNEAKVRCEQIITDVLDKSDLGYRLRVDAINRILEHNEILEAVLAETYATLNELGELL